jgi:hypothetical protein
MSGLSRAVYAIAKTMRRRFLWCVWWSGEPTAKPFRAPDAWGGGARTEEEARALAERAAGMPLDPVDGHWAGAWKRMQAGLPPFPKATVRPTASTDVRAKPVDPYVLLEHHPDRGGTPAEFMAMKRAYDSIVKRRARKRAR